MPKIKINEVDNTQPGTRGYSNFTVVVPGFHAPYCDESMSKEDREKIGGILLQKTETKFDENDEPVTSIKPMDDVDVFGEENLLEIKTQADFETYIGIVPPKATEEGFKYEVVVKDVIDYDDVTLAESRVKYYANVARDKKADAEFTVVMDRAQDTITFNYNNKTEDREDDISETFLYSIDGFDVSLIYAKKDESGNWVQDTDFLEPVADTAAYVEINDDQDIVKANFKPISRVADATDPSKLVVEFEQDAETKIKTPKHVENDEVIGGWTVDEAIAVFTREEDVRLPAHYGNQIAFELLGLGYTVYYMNMGEYNPTRTAFVDASGKEVVGADAEDEDAGITEDKQFGLRKVCDAYRALGREPFWAELRDKTTYDFRFVLTGFIDNQEEDKRFFDFMKNASSEIVKLASWVQPTEDVFSHVRARGDVLALVDLDETAIRGRLEKSAGGVENTTKRTINAIKKELRRQNFGGYGKYAAVFSPSVTYTNNNRADEYGNSNFPASFHYLACFAKSVFADNYKEWFAIAGFTRGVSAFNIETTAFKLGDIAVQALEPRIELGGKDPINVAINVIVHNRGLYYIWGNRTAHQLDNRELVASHFLNIRQLCISLKKFIYTLCRNFTFDPNSDILWTNFTVALKPLLEVMKANQGIRDYKIERVPTTLKGTLAAKIRIIPIEAVEDFDIEVSLEDSFNGVSATVAG